MWAAYSNQLRSGPAVASSGNSFFSLGHGGEGGGYGGEELADLLTPKLLSPYYLLLILL